MARVFPSHNFVRNTVGLQTSKKRHNRNKMQARAENTGVRSCEFAPKAGFFRNPFLSCAHSRFSGSLKHTLTMAGHKSS